MNRNVDRIISVLMLRQKGWGFGRIAKQLNISRQRAHVIYHTYKDTPVDQLGIKSN